MPASADSWAGVGWYRDAPSSAFAPPPITNAAACLGCDSRLELGLWSTLGVKFKSPRRRRLSRLLTSCSTACSSSASHPQVGYPREVHGSQRGRRRRHMEGLRGPGAPPPSRYQDPPLSVLRLAGFLTRALHSRRRLPCLSDSHRRDADSRPARDAVQRGGPRVCPSGASSEWSGEAASCL